MDNFSSEYAMYRPYQPGKLRIRDQTSSADSNERVKIRYFPPERVVDMQAEGTTVFQFQEL